MISSENPKCWNSIRLDKSPENNNYLIENSIEVLKTVKSLNLSLEIKNLLLGMDWSKKKVLVIDQVFINEKIGLESIDTLQSVIHLISYNSPFTLPFIQLPRIEGKYPKECLIIPIPREFSLQSIRILKKSISIPNIVEFSEITESIRTKSMEFFEIMHINKDFVKTMENEANIKRFQKKKNPSSLEDSLSDREHTYITAICAFERIVRGQHIA